MLRTRSTHLDPSSVLEIKDMDGNKVLTVRVLTGHKGNTQVLAHTHPFARTTLDPAQQDIPNILTLDASPDAPLETPHD